MSKKSRKNWGLEAKPEDMEQDAQDDGDDILEEETPGEPRLEFDSWWAMRFDKIPAHHYKEIVKADMRARGLGHSESATTFDKALAKYGISL